MNSNLNLNILSFVCSIGDKEILNLLGAKDIFNVPMQCPAAKKPQQIVAAQPKHSNKPKVHTNTALPTKRKQTNEKSIFFLLEKKISRGFTRQKK